ncbi:asparaginyl-tRNA synthetase [Laetiporus sulphureus 93-53]|uniref:Asparagine--tRNA ligase, mitochondrial n=1 Tax=Laetiporus sulphureus 93-53 TaxID=1314785 RepID=A0A165IK91_9APHY|nr:asparaginyl-tRNA synthetase [Laetiporus sulphureus 93-53]KZT13194.1 asparaginyl-tRNA synthetase [Laetiporus sulphureus 93-53]
MVLPRLRPTFSLPPTVRQLLSSQIPSGSSVEVSGWVKSIRKQKNIAFAVITDGSLEQGLQAVFPDVTQAKALTNGVSVRLGGTISDSPGRGQDKELQVSSVEVVGDCDSATYPIQKKALTVEYLRDHCHFRARTDAIASMLRLRDSASRSLHQFFETHGFTNVHTPILTSNDCEGAGETFRIAPTSSPLTSSSPSHVQPEFFGHPAYLTVSSQLHLEALAASLSRVYTLSPCFRAERSQTNRHLAEFWMLEAEWAFTRTVDDICALVEAAVRTTLADCRGACEALAKHSERKELLNELDSAQESVWARISYTDAVKELEAHHAAARTFVFEPALGKALQSEHERWLAEEVVRGPVFVTDYPAELKPFYMRANDDGQTVACFDLLIPHLGELVGGSLREERLDLLERALDHHKLSREDYDWYVDLRKFGGAPHGGFGMGFERLISWMGGIDNVRECIAMPRWAGRMLL